MVSPACTSVPLPVSELLFNVNRAAGICLNTVELPEKTDRVIMALLPVPAATPNKSLTEVIFSITALFGPVAVNAIPVDPL